MFVDKDYRNRGIGQALYDKVESQLKELGCKNITLCAYSPSYFFAGLDAEHYPESISFFEKNGYVYYSEIYAECKIVKVESSDNGVATASVRNLDTMTSIIAITPHKAGTATVTAYNDSGISENISVTVKKNWEKAYLKSICYFSAAYRTKSVYLSAPSGSVFTFKIKNKKSF
jgi:predicted GNAT family acetyltransferase